MQCNSKSNLSRTAHLKSVIQEERYLLQSDFHRLLDHMDAYKQSHLSLQATKLSLLHGTERNVKRVRKNEIYHNADRNLKQKCPSSIRKLQ